MIRDVIFCCALSAAVFAQEWRYYGGDAGGTKYSPLKQINRTNVTKLQTAWVFHTGDVSDGKTLPVRSVFEATPLVIDGVMYVTTPFNRLIALDPETGREVWAFDPKLDLKKFYFSLYVNRGAAYWTDGKRHRLFYGTLDGRLFSIDADNGKPDGAFGEGGFLNLRAGMADKYPNASYGMSSPPAIYRNVVICGSRVPDGEPQGPSGDVRAFDVHTGKLLWRFHTIPPKGEFGNDTWDGDSWIERGGANAWSILSVDEERGIVYLPLTSPATDSWGGDRKGQDLFGDSLVALDALPGKRIWHFQTIHHNVWDYDLPAQPNLITVRRNGAPVPAVSQVTKTGFAFLFHRYTGKPLFDIEEKAVPASEIPGEHVWPSQPFPLKPPPYLRQSMRADEITSVTPESEAYCGKLLGDAVLGTIYTPLGLKPTVLFPGADGGANWGGASFDPETHTLYVNSMDVGRLTRMVKRPGGALIPYRSQSMGSLDSRFWDPKMWPCQKPPWGHLTAIDLNRGEHRWRSVLGVVDELIAKGLPPTGTPTSEDLSLPRAASSSSVRRTIAAFGPLTRKPAGNSGSHVCRPAGTQLL
jgi:quinoprotein glucose dehydrogenase